MTKKASSTESAIRVFFLFRRIATVLGLLLLVTLLSRDAFDPYFSKLKKKKLELIFNNGISKQANLKPNYLIEQYENGSSKKTIGYYFEFNGKKYENTYSFYGAIPEEVIELEKFITVHFLEESPDENSLNIEYEIENIRIRNDSTAVFIGQIVFIIIGTLFFILQLLALIHDIKNLDNPIKTSEHVKSTKANSD